MVHVPRLQMNRVTVEIRATKRVAQWFSEGSNAVARPKEMSRPKRTGKFSDLLSIHLIVQIFSG